MNYQGPFNMESARLINRQIPTGAHIKSVLGT